MNANIKISNIEQTEKLGLMLGISAQPGDIICLSGDLGAGKTTLTQFLARGMEVKDSYVTSPSFSIMHEYQGRLILYHMDLYRLGGEDEVIDLGFEDLFYGDGLTVIEWPERAGDLIPDTALLINIKLDDTERTIEFTCSDTSHWQEDIQIFIGS
ncbi:MAG: tRNA (adenosine(37)-N6)-threonylcarbamoyltransferase complex ATPase subunit type 1 TsaE [Desulfotalea sp.]